MSYKINPAGCKWYWNSMGYALEENKHKLGGDYLTDKAWARYYENTFGIKTNFEDDTIEFPSEAEAVMFMLRWS